MTELRLVLLGLGNVGQSFVRLLNNKISVLTVARVTPRMLSLSTPLAHVNGSSAAITLFTDTLGEITIYLNESEVPQTAYATLADLTTIMKTHYAQ